MVKILDRDEVEDTRNWQCRDGNDLSDDRLNDLCDSHEALRDLLRRVMAAPCDTSDGEYGTRPVREAMGPGFRGWSTTGEKNAALLAEVDAAVEVKP